MCCLFGLLDYGHSFTGKQKAKMVHALATSAEARGTDASGIAYNSGGKLHIYKRPIPGHQLTFRIPNSTAVIMGHARMTTQGDGERNYNNHPFLGRTDDSVFALAHNGVLHNDRTLRKTLKLPRTKIETDSYVAVQLIQKKKALTFDSLKYMAEQVEGSFSFTVLDDQDNFYFVKGDNPLCIYHYPECGLYLYASNNLILANALLNIPYPLGEAEEVMLDGGDLLLIRLDGTQQQSKFQYNDPFSFSGFGYWGWPRRRTSNWEQDSRIRDLKSVARAYGLAPDQVDYLLSRGYDPEEIEDYLYYSEL